MAYPEGADMRMREPRSFDQQLSDYPIYTVPEAARYLGMSGSTLYNWVSYKSLWTPAGANYPVRLLSFKDIAQSHFIEFIRHHAHISARTARDILKYAKMETGSDYPLLDADIKVLLGHVLLDKPKSKKIARSIVDLSHHRQLMITQFVDLYTTRVRRNSQGETEQIYPWRFWTQKESERKPVSIDANVMSGKLVVTGTRIPVDALAIRKRAGESVTDLAKDYGLAEDIISDALRHLALRKAA